MPPLGTPQSNRPRKPFNLAEHNHGEQVNSVRSKIASLMDGVTEGRVSARLSSTDAATDAPAEGKEQTPTGDIQEHAEADVHQDDDSDRNKPYPTVHPTNLSERNQVRFSLEEDPAHWPRRASSSASQNRETPLPPERNGWEQATSPLPANAQQTSGSWLENEQHEETTHHDNVYPPHDDDTRWNEPGLRREDFNTTEQQTAGESNQPTQGGQDREFQKSSSEQHPAQPAVAGAITIKGRAGGILIEIGNGAWPELVVALADRLAGAANFFRNGNTAIDLGLRPLTEPELGQLRTLLDEHSLELVLIRTASPETFQVALDMGISAQLETPEGETTATAQPSLSNLLQEHHFVYSGHLRAGQVLQRNEHILVIGDVNPGATVISNGDILVWGHLRGVAHAGAGGDSGAIICALDLTPVQIRIGDLIAIAPEPEQPRRLWGRKPATIKQPEIAYTAGDRINVEPWDATKFGGIATFRRQ